MLVSIASVITYKVVLLGTGKEYTHYVLVNSTLNGFKESSEHGASHKQTSNVILWQRELLQVVDVNRMCCGDFIPCPTEPVKPLLNHLLLGQHWGWDFEMLYWRIDTRATKIHSQGICGRRSGEQHFNLTSKNSRSVQPKISFF